jgi:hypothetical protein
VIKQAILQKFKVFLLAMIQKSIFISMADSELGLND